MARCKKFRGNFARRSAFFIFFTVLLVLVIKHVFLEEIYVIMYGKISEQVVWLCYYLNILIALPIVYFLMHRLDTEIEIDNIYIRVKYDSLKISRKKEKNYPINSTLKFKEKVFMFLGLIPIKRYYIEYNTQRTALNFFTEKEISKIESYLVTNELNRQRRFKEMNMF